MNYIGDFAEDETVYFMFNTFTSDDPSASCTITNLLNTDVHIHKDDGLTQRNNAAGITVSVNFDGITGSHMLKIDTNDNTVGGFWVTGSDYFVRIEGTTIDGATINAVVGHFSIQNRFMRGTNSAATATALSTHDGKLDTVDGIVDNILVDTGTTLDGKLNTIDGIVDNILIDTGTTLDGKLNTIDTVVDSILSDTDDIGVAGAGLTAVPWNAAWDTEVQSECNDALVALNLDHLIQHASTVSDAGATATQFYTALSEGTDDHYNKMIIVFTSGVLAGQARIISDYDGGFKGITVSPAFTEAPANSDPFIILPLYSEIMRGTEGANTTVPDAAGVAPTVGEIRTEMEGAGSKILAIEGDTNELQTNQGAWATATGFSTHSAANVWAVAARTLTANTNFNDLDAAAIKAEAVAALADIKLDHLVNIAVDTDWATTVHLDSVIGHLADVGTAATFNRTTDALEAIRNRGDGAWITATGFNTTTPPTVTQIRQEMDTNSTKMAPSQVLADYKATGFNTVVPDAAGVAPTAIEIRQEMDTNSTKMAPSQTLNDYKATGFNTTTPPTVGQIRAEMEGAGYKLALIEADTNALQTDWVNGGRLDLILDIIASDTTTDIPAKLLKYVQLLSRSDAAIATDNSTELTAINADGGSGAGDFSNQTDAPEAIRDRGDAEWITATGFNTVVPDAAGVAPTAAEIRQEMDANSTKMAPSQVLADYKATGFNTVVPDAAGVAPTAAEIKTEIEQAGSILAQILADTGTDGVLLAATATSAQLVDDIWDEIITGAFHNIVNSAARRLREIGAFAIESGTAQAGTISTITLAATANGADGIFNRNLIVLTDNTGKGQTRTIVDYNATTKVVVIDRDWRVSPDATTTYQIVPDDTPLTVDHGVVQDATATTITIRDYASDADDAYLCNIVTILAGTGRGQARLVGAYNGTTKVATICGDDWVTTPDTTSVYAMMPYGVACAACVGTDASDAIADGVLDELTADHTIAGSLSKAIADTLEDTDNLQTNQSAWATATSVTVSDKTGFSLSAAGIAAIWDEIIEGAHTARQYLRTFAAVLLGKSSGGGTDTLTFRDIDDSKDRVVATADEDGNRLAVVLDES